MTDDCFDRVLVGSSTQFIVHTSQLVPLVVDIMMELVVSLVVAIIDQLHYQFRIWRLKRSMYC